MAAKNIICYCGTSVTDDSGIILLDRFLQSWSLQATPVTMYMSIYASSVAKVLDVIAKYTDPSLLTAKLLFSNITTDPTLNHWTYLSNKWPVSTAYGATTWILFDDGFSIWESTRIQTLYNLILQNVIVQNFIWCPTYVIQTYLSEDQIDPLVNNQSIVVYNTGTDNGHFMMLGPYSNYTITGELNVFLRAQIPTAFQVLSQAQGVWMFNRVSPSIYGIT